MSARERLLELLRARSFAKKRVVLASGRESDFFIDCKQTVLGAEAHALVGEILFDAVRAWSPVAVAGVELGGCPLASAVALTSHLRGAPIDAVYVRKDAKTTAAGARSRATRTCRAARASRSSRTSSRPAARR